MGDHVEDAERRRLREDAGRVKHWRRWGPYLADRQWGTVREDYSADGDAWGWLTHDMSRFFAYRWGEDGLAGISDNHQRLCFALALWNGKDPILKERLFGLANPEGNHGEDVKECYWHVDNTPSHAFMRFLYRYPQTLFPYDPLLTQNAQRDRTEPEFEIEETGVFDEERYFDVEIDYAKADADDLCIRIRAVNRGPDPADLHLIPTLWFRNAWRFSRNEPRPSIWPLDPGLIVSDHQELGLYYLAFEGEPDVMFTENESNNVRLYAARNRSHYVKDAFHRHIVEDEANAVTREGGTKCGLHYRFTLEPGEEAVLRLRLVGGERLAAPFEAFEDTFDARAREADAFYATAIPADATGEDRMLARRAFAGLLWSKQWYHYVVETWLRGDPGMPKPPKKRLEGRNAEWVHHYSDDILSVPDKWEYPWFAVWDSAFQSVTMALIDPEFAKRQLTVLSREWYLHPNGQMPAYEWDFSDVNPPVHAWAALRVYRTAARLEGRHDTDFLEAVFHKLLMNFTWWVNRKDVNGSNVFQGGFLGMDNIGVFDRSAPPPFGALLEQSDATSWMAMYCLNMLAISWELARHKPVYEDIASKFLEHFLYIANAIHNIEGTGDSLWDEQDGFFYDQLLIPEEGRKPLRVRSMVGLIPLLAVEMLDYERIDAMPGFNRRLKWFFENRPDLCTNILCVFGRGAKGRCLLSLPTHHQLLRLLAVLFDESEFLSDFGIRSLSKVHRDQPCEIDIAGHGGSVRYEPGDSTSAIFGGNSNWRGPVWFPVNFLLIEALRRFHDFFGDNFRVECPTGSGNRVTLDAAADLLAQRLLAIFRLDGDRRPVFGDRPLWKDAPEWRDQPLFYEFFHGDTGAGLGASHQTGWTALLANLICESRHATRPRP